MSIINCGKRRLVSYRYGWKIEISKTHLETDKKYWAEDSPAFPATLAQGLEMICERELKETPMMTPESLPDALKRAVAEVRKYMLEARALSKEIG